MFKGFQSLKRYSLVKSWKNNSVAKPSFFHFIKYVKEFFLRFVKIFFQQKIYEAKDIQFLAFLLIQFATLIILPFIVANLSLTRWDA